MKSFVLSTGMELFVHSRFGTQKFVGALKVAYLYSEQEKSMFAIMMVLGEMFLFMMVTY